MPLFECDGSLVKTGRPKLDCSPDLNKADGSKRNQPAGQALSIEGELGVRAAA